VGLDLAEKVDIALPHVGDSGRSDISMDMPKAVAMYKAGQTWTEIAGQLPARQGPCKRARKQAHCEQNSCQAATCILAKADTWHTRRPSAEMIKELGNGAFIEMPRPGKPYGRSVGGL
jgi:hypothetical protein